MIPLGPVVARHQVAASRETVWHFIVDDARRTQWFAELHFGAARAAEVSAGDKRGVLDVFIRGHVLGFKWAAAEQLPTSVILTLRTVNGGTLITVTETGFDALSEGAAAAAAAQQQWNQALQSLAAADFSEVLVPALYAEHEAALAAAAAAGADHTAIVSAAPQGETAPAEEETEAALPTVTAADSEPQPPAPAAADADAEETPLLDLGEVAEIPLPALEETAETPASDRDAGAAAPLSDQGETAAESLPAAEQQPEPEEVTETPLPALEEEAETPLPDLEESDPAPLPAAEPTVTAPATPPAVPEHDAFAELFGESFAADRADAAAEHQLGRPDPTPQKHRDLPKRKWWQL